MVDLGRLEVSNPEGEALPVHRVDDGLEAAERGTGRGRAHPTHGTVRGASAGEQGPGEGRGDAPKSAGQLRGRPHTFLHPSTAISGRRAWLSRGVLWAFGASGLDARNGIPGAVLGDPGQKFARIAPVQVDP